MFAATQCNAMHFIIKWKPKLFDSPEMLLMCILIVIEWLWTEMSIQKHCHLLIKPFNKIPYKMKKLNPLVNYTGKTNCEWKILQKS